MSTFMCMCRGCSQVPRRALDGGGGANSLQVRAVQGGGYRGRRRGPRVHGSPRRAYPAWLRLHVTALSQGMYMALASPAHAACTAGRSRQLPTAWHLRSNPARTGVRVAVRRWGGVVPGAVERPVPPAHVTETAMAARAPARSVGPPPAVISDARSGARHAAQLDRVKSQQHVCNE